MTETIVVLTEDALTDADVTHITGLHADDDVRFHVLVPADTEQNMLASLVDHLSLGELREALDAVLRREPEPVRAFQTAEEQLDVSVERLRAAGADADGVVVSDDPLPALRAATADVLVREIVVVTLPHALEDTFHTDWASRARDELDVPVLHMYTGTSQLG